MRNVKSWYRTLELSAHTLCEQAYDPSNLIEIAKYLEETTGVKANPVVPTIKRTIQFHIWWDKKEKIERRQRHADNT